MLKKFNRLLGACACLMLLSSGLAYAYDYPFADPYVATVVSTPAEYAKNMPEKVPLKFGSIEMFPGRKVPGILWNLKKLYYSYLRQKGPAPLIFNGVSAIDKRHRESFRYYRTGSPFEYEMIRMLYTTKREMEIAK